MTDRKAPEDSSLIQLAQRTIDGDLAARDELLQQLSPLIVRTTRLIVGPGAWIAEDAAQEALVDVMEGVGRLREPRYVRAWALRVATNRALKVASASGRRALRVSDPDDKVLSVDFPHRELGLALKTAIYELPPRVRAVVILRLYVGLSEAEASSVMDLPIGTIKSTLHTARWQLRSFLERENALPSVRSRTPDVEGGPNGDT